MNEDDLNKVGEKSQKAESFTFALVPIETVSSGYPRTLPASRFLGDGVGGLDGWQKTPSDRRQQRQKKKTQLCNEHCPQKIG